MTFLIARPKEKAEQTLAEFINHGLEAEILPLLDITLMQGPAISARLNEAKPSCIIITSTYAAQWLARAIKANSVSLNFADIKIICVGRSTAQLITTMVNCNNITIASPENSEGILALKCLKSVESKSIVLLKGQGGRDLIPTTLHARKANLTALNVYKRAANIGAINGFAFEQSEIKCIIATSIEIAELLMSTIDITWLQSCQWIVASERIKDYASKKGIQNITVSQGASNKALLDSANQLVITGVLND